MREGGLEPPRPYWTLEPESSESANSTTRAYALPDARDSFDILTSELINVNTKNTALPGEYIVTVYAHHGLLRKK